MLNIDYKFKEESLLRLAMTHSSYANEHHGTHLQCNERLEFLGDSVLGFVTAGYLFTHYPDLPEGDLTKLRAAVVCEGALDEIAHEIGIPEAIRLGHGEEMGGGRKRASILADATEALLGAIFMDGGIEPARAFVLRFIPHKVEVALAGGAFKDYKTMLQEIVQKNKQETLEYRLAGQSGPDHDKRFTMELLLNSNVFASGTARSKKEAEQLAAKKALELISDGDVIFLDASSSAYALVPYLATKSGLTVITGGLKSASRLCEYGIRTVCIGGLLIPEAGSMIGSDAFSILDRYNADICFFSCRGLSYDGLLTDISPDEDHVRQHMIRRAKRSYLLCAGEKIGRLYYHNLAHISEITGVISESPLPDFSAAGGGNA